MKFRTEFTGILINPAVLGLFMMRNFPSNPSILSPMKKLIISLTSIALFSSARAADPDFVKDIAPVLEASCVKCHHGEKAKGKLRIDTKEGAFKGGKNGKFIVAGKPDESALIKVLLLEPSDDDAMPPEGKAPRPDAEKIELLKKWVAAGATWPDDAKLKVPEPKK
ncbi:MAG: hypothetical protein EOP86_10560 [Verrucomicrobiaceae bacterium]|nr:MAG: hypothetical protein EOP86_10560 [Verrucomicrobiaceae bacterium]